MPARIYIFVSGDVFETVTEDGNEDHEDSVCILLEGAEIVDVGGELYPMIEAQPMVAMKVSQAINDCIAEIVKRKAREG